MGQPEKLEGSIDFPRRLKPGEKIRKYWFVKEDKWQWRIQTVSWTCSSSSSTTKPKKGYYRTSCPFCKSFEGKKMFDNFQRVGYICECGGVVVRPGHVCKAVFVKKGKYYPSSSS